MAGLVLLGQVFLLLLLLPVSLIAPGWAIVRQWPWHYREKITAALGLSLIVIYIIAAVVYVLGMPWWSVWIATAVFVYLCTSASKDLLLLWRRTALRSMLKAYALLLLVSFSFVAISDTGGRLVPQESRT